MGMAAMRAFDPALIVSVLEEHGGKYPFFKLTAVLGQLGLSEAEARDFVWRLLSEGVIRFSSDRNDVQLAPEERAEKVAG